MPNEAIHENGRADIPDDGDYSAYTGSVNALLAALQDRTKPAAKPKLRATFSSPDTALIPAEYRSSRDAAKIAAYLDGDCLGTDGQPLRTEARQELIRHVAGLAYYDRLAEKFIAYNKRNNYSDYTGSARELLEYLQERPDAMPKPTIREPFVTDSMKIPLHINCTGDMDVIANYLDNQPLDTTGRPLGSAARRHLIDRMVNTAYVSKRAEEFQNIKYQPLPARELPNGCVLQGIHQPERQETFHCCWSMPVKLMLQSRGIDLDQESIRCYKPELSQACIDADGHRDVLYDEDRSENGFIHKLVDGYTKNADGEAGNLAPLVNKLIPNCAMMKHRFEPMFINETERAAKIEANTALLKKVVTNALRQHRSPIALCINRHYRTIVGIDGDELILKDSLSMLHGPDEDHKIPISSLFASRHPTFELFYLRDLSLVPDGELPEELAELNRHTPDCYDKYPFLASYRSNECVRIVGVQKDGPNKGNLFIPHANLRLGGFVSCFEQPVLDVPSITVDGRVVTDSAVMILPKKLNDRFITLQMPQEIRAEVLPEDAAKPLNSSGGYAVSDRVALEASFLAEVPDSDYRRILEMGNEARMELRQLCNPPEGESAEAKVERTEKLRLAMLSMLFAKQVEAERFLQNGKPGALEKTFTQEVNFQQLLQSETLQRLYQNCPDPARMTVKDAEDFILNDTAGKIVRKDFSDALNANKKLSQANRQAMQNQLLNATDPNHETERLKMLYQKLQDADPKLMRSSDEFKKMRQSMESLIRLRESRTASLGDGVTPEQKQEAAAALAKAYMDFGKSAREYMNTKNLSILKEGSTARARYDVANAAMDFSDELQRVHLERIAELDRQSVAPSAQKVPAKERQPKNLT